MSVRERLVVGEETVVASDSRLDSVATVFEDDGETGYFYAVQLPDQEILDAVHIYDVASVADRDRESEVEIQWSRDGLKAALWINAYPHAVFDFVAKRGYCRTDFPNFPGAGENGWRKDTHRWDDAIMSDFESALIGPAAEERT